MEEKINVTFKFILTSGKTARVIEIEAAVVGTAKVASLIGAIREEFGEDVQISPNQDFQMYVQAPSNATLEQLGIEEGDALLLVAGSSGRLVERRRK